MSTEKPVLDLTEEEKGLVLFKKYLVKNQKVELRDIIPDVAVYEYNTAYSKVTIKDTLLHDVDDSLNDYYRIAFVDCEIFIAARTKVNFVSCTFINCVFSGCWAMVKISYDSEFKNCTMSPTAYLRRCDMASFDTFNYAYNINYLRANNPARFGNNVDIPEHLLAVPAKGSFIGYKSAMAVVGNKNIRVIVLLRIPEDAKRVSFLSYKCRANTAGVVDIYDIHGNKYDKAYALRDIQQDIPLEHCFTYEKGKIVTSDMWDGTPTEECTHGIHFFMKEGLAVEWIH